MNERKVKRRAFLLALISEGLLVLLFLAMVAPRVPVAPSGYLVVEFGPGGEVRPAAAALEGAPKLPEIPATPRAEPPAAATPEAPAKPKSRAEPQSPTPAQTPAPPRVASPKAPKPGQGTARTPKSPKAPKQTAAKAPPPTPAPSTGTRPEPTAPTEVPVKTPAPAPPGPTVTEKAPSPPVSTLPEAPSKQPEAEIQPPPAKVGPGPAPSPPPAASPPATAEKPEPAPALPAASEAPPEPETSPAPTSSQPALPQAAPAVVERAPAASAAPSLPEAVPAARPPELPAPRSALPLPPGPSVPASPGTLPTESAPQIKAPIPPSAAPPSPQIGSEGGAALGEGNRNYDVTWHSPLLISVDNARAGFPQTGLEMAQRIYEFPVEGGVTRLILETRGGEAGPVGPVRSARVYLLQLADALGGFLVHVGGSPKAQKIMDEKAYVTFDGLYDRKHFFRDERRKPPHNAYAEAGAIRSELGRLGLDGVKRYRGAAYRPGPGARPGQRVVVKFAPDYWSEFRFEEGGYRWYRAGERTRAFVAAVVVVEVGARVVDAEGRLSLELGQGPATLYLAGKQVALRWRFGSGGFQLQDEKGKAVDLTPYRVWYILKPNYR